MIIKNAAAAHIPALSRLWEDNFGDTPEFIRGFFQTGFSPERSMLAEENGTVLGSLYWFDCQWENRKIAYIYAVSTHKDHRGKGICRQLMDAAHAQLKEDGYAGSILVPAEETLFRLYGKMGYIPCCPASAVTLDSTQPAAELTALSPEEYWFMRLAFLPRNGIVQNSETLQFYATYGNFYQLQGSICAAAVHEGEAYIQEFFGKVEDLPRIGAALGCEKVHARLPGGENYAMYRSLTGETALPGYLGIPLD